MKGSRKLVQDIMSNHYSNVKTQDETPGIAIVDEDVAKASKVSKIPQEPVKPKRKRRTKLEMEQARALEASKAGTSEKASKVQIETPPLPQLEGANMFTVTVVGGVGLPGYPLKKGEKLAIVKLTPIAISK